MRVGLLKILLPLGLLSALASATPVTWTLSGVTFSDGGTASGSLVYNADTNSYSSINIHTTLGSLRAAANYLFVGTGVAASANGVQMVTLGSGDLTSQPTFLLFFSAALTNAGGTRTVNTSVEANCANAACTSPAAPSRTVSAGSIQSAAAGVPEPTSALLLGLGFIVLGAVHARRRKTV